MKDSMTYLHGLIEKYSGKHKELKNQLESSSQNLFQIELLMVQLKIITDFLKDLRLIKANNER